MRNPNVLVESEIKHKILHKNIEKCEQEAMFSKMCQENDCFATLYLSKTDSKIEELITNQITAFAIV